MSSSKKPAHDISPTADKSATEAPPNQAASDNTTGKGTPPTADQPGRAASSPELVPIPILDDSLRISLLLYLLAVAERGGDEGNDLVAAGFTPAQVTLLRGLTASSLVRVADAVKRHMKIVIDAASVMHALTAILQSNLAADQIVELRSSGAPLTMLRSLFPAMRNMVDAFDDHLRKQEAESSRKAARSGRTAMPPESLRLLILNVWYGMGKRSAAVTDPTAWIALRKSLIEEHGQAPQDVPFGVLWIVINED